jgi:hypothetical protein
MSVQMDAPFSARANFSRAVEIGGLKREHLLGIWN